MGRQAGFMTAMLSAIVMKTGNLAPEDLTASADMNSSNPPSNDCR